MRSLIRNAALYLRMKLDKGNFQIAKLIDYTSKCLSHLLSPFNLTFVCRAAQEFRKLTVMMVLHSG
jgi:hypothetical protein